MIIPASVMAQKDVAESRSKIAELHKIVENIYPINDEYINGFIYPISNTRINGDPYFNSPELIEGTLFINKKAYSNKLIKYDLIIDELIIKTKTEQDIERLLILNKSQLDSFLIGTDIFVNSRILFPEEKSNTFYQKIHQGNLSVYKHYEKRFIDTYTSSSPFGKYSDQKSTLYLFNDKQLININQKKMFLNSFEKNNQALIRKYIKLKKIKYKNISRSQLIDLIEYTIKLTSE